MIFYAVVGPLASRFRFATSSTTSNWAFSPVKSSPGYARIRASCIKQNHAHIVDYISIYTEATQLLANHYSCGGEGGDTLLKKKKTGRKWFCNNKKKTGRKWVTRKNTPWEMSLPIPSFLTKRGNHAQTPAVAWHRMCSLHPPPNKKQNPTKQTYTWQKTLVKEKKTKHFHISMRLIQEYIWLKKKPWEKYPTHPPPPHPQQTKMYPLDLAYRQVVVTGVCRC